MALGLADLLNYEKISKEIGLYSPVFIYGWILYNHKLPLLIIMLIISILLSALFIVIKQEFIGIYDIDKNKPIYVDNKKFVKKLGGALAIPFIIKSILVYLTFINLIISAIFALLYLIYIEFELVTLLMVIMALAAIFYRIFLLIFSTKGIKQLSKNIKKLS